MTLEGPTSADDLGHELAMQLRGAYARLRRQSNLVFSAFGMTTDQYVLLSVLAREGEATQQDLARRCYSDTATIGAMVSLLEAKRLVGRRPHPEDGRAWSVALAPAGLILAERMRQSSSGLRIKLAGLFEEHELSILIEYLGRLAGALKPPRRKPPAPRPRPRERRGSSGHSKRPKGSLLRSHPGQRPASVNPTSTH